MRLLAHPAALCGSIRNFDANAERSANGLLRLNLRLKADLSQLQVPPAAAPARADGLWRHTCFEAFIAAPGSPAYCELNFSPSGEWAAYAFTGYRTGMTPLHLPAAPAARWHRDSTKLELEVALRPGELLPGADAIPLRVGLCAVIEEQSGTISYWALWHPAGKPDFHHPDGFVLELAISNSAAGREIEGT